MRAMKTGRFVALLLAVWSVSANAQSSRTCDSVVRTVAFENTTGLTAEQRTSLSKLLVGRCFQLEHPDVLSEAVYQQLQRWGYRQPVVYDPEKGHDIRVLDGTLYPTPVAVTVDFRLRGSDFSK